MSNIKTLPDVLTVGEVATYLRVSKTTICRWCSSGALPAFRIGRGWRIRRSDLENYINSGLDNEKKDTDPRSFS
jgi:excisionase family DNA binding protein